MVVDPEVAEAGGISTFPSKCYLPSFNGVDPEIPHKSFIGSYNRQI